MNEETLNMSIRKFLKMVGVSSQRSIEHAIEDAIADGRITGNETMPATMTLRIDRLGLDIEFDGEIALD